MFSTPSRSLPLSFPSPSHSLYLHKIKHPPRSANKFHCEPTIQTIIPCTNSFAALLSHAINTAHADPPPPPPQERMDVDAISDKCSQIRQTDRHSRNFWQAKALAAAPPDAAAALRLWHNCYVIVELSRIANCEEQQRKRERERARQTRI